MKIGVIQGRFHPFHNGHLEYALWALLHVEHLIVGITNPDPENTRQDKAHSKRHEISNNPFTYYERMQMIKQSLLDHGVPYEKFDVVPFPINFPERLKYYVPASAIHFTATYEEWNRRKIEILEEQGFTVQNLIDATMDDRPHTLVLPMGKYGLPGEYAVQTGSYIRDLMSKGEEWEQYVPSGSARVIRESKLQ